MKYLLTKASDARMDEFDNVYPDVTLERIGKDFKEDKYYVYSIDVDSPESLNTFIECVGGVIINKTKNNNEFCYGLQWVFDKEDVEFVESFPYTIMIYDTYVE